MAKKDYQYVRKSTYYNGKRYYVRGLTEREARRKLAALLAELQANGAKMDSSTSVRKWSAEWLAVYVSTRDITAKSAAMYQQKLDNYILPEIGDMKIGDVKDIHLKKLLNKANSSYSTAQKVRIVLQAMFRQARKSRLIPFDPSEDLDLPKAPKGHRGSISDYERQMILEVADYHRSGLYVLTLLYTGIRPGEAIALQWKDIDRKEHTLDISKALESGNSQAVKDPKSAAGKRSVPLPDALWPRLEAARRGPFDYVFLQPLGKKRHTESSINDAWNNFKRALDIHMGAEVYRNQIMRHCWEVHWEQETEAQWKALVPYSLRHTYCTDLQRSGVSINVAKYLMGHSDISVTGNIYTDSTPDVIFDAVKRLNSFHAGGADREITPEMEKVADALA